MYNTLNSRKHVSVKLEQRRKVTFLILVTLKLKRQTKELRAHLVQDLKRIYFIMEGKSWQQGIVNRLIITRFLQWGRRERQMLLIYYIHLIQPGTTTTEIVSVVFGRVFLPLERPSQTHNLNCVSWVSLNLIKLVSTSRYSKSLKVCLDSQCLETENLQPSFEHLRCLLVTCLMVYQLSLLCPQQVKMK